MRLLRNCCRGQRSEHVIRRITLSAPFSVFRVFVAASLSRKCSLVAVRNSLQDGPCHTHDALRFLVSAKGRFHIRRCASHVVTQPAKALPSTRLVGTPKNGLPLFPSVHTRQDRQAIFPVRPTSRERLHRHRGWMDARLLCEACSEAVTAVRLSCLLPLVKRYWEPPCGAGEALSLARADVCADARPARQQHEIVGCGSGGRLDRCYHFRTFCFFCE